MKDTYSLVASFHSFRILGFDNFFKQERTIWVEQDRVSRAHHIQYVPKCVTKVSRLAMGGSRVQ